MNISKLLGAAIVAGALAIASMPAQASLIPYSQAINEQYGVGGQFDQIDAFVFAPTTDLTLSAFSNGSWSNTVKTPRWSEATGNLSSDLTFDINFDYVSQPLQYDFFAFKDGDIVDSARFTLNDGLSVVDPLEDADATYRTDVASAVPEPGTIALLGTALFGLGILGLQRRRDPALAFSRAA